MSQKAFKFALVAVQSAALFALFSVPASAQSLMPGFQLGGPGAQMSPEEKERSDANERAAKEAQKTIKPPKVSSDPWGDMRAADAPKTTKSSK